MTIGVPDSARIRHRRGSVGAEHDIQALVAQNDAQHLGQRQVVIDDEYAMLHQMSFRPWDLHRLHRPIPNPHEQ
jgi:hypothetical protein